MLSYPNGTINLVSLIDIIIILWSLYAFFMVLGLSEDTIGKPFADVFRGLSKIFLQLCFIVLGVFSIPFGLIIYGVRFIFALFIILTALIVYFILYKTPKFSLKQLSPKYIKEYFKSGKVKKNLPLILMLVFLFSTTVVLQYPESWFASSVIVFIAFVVAAATVSILIASQKSKDDEMKNEYNI